VGATTWAAQPETTDEAVRAATGRGWEEWRALLDAWPGRDDGHGAIAAHVQEEYGVDSWWAQTVTVGYERISGRRLPYQQPDGTFSVNASRTVAIGAVDLRERLLDDAQRKELFADHDTELRSKQASKNVRIRIDGGTVEFALEPRDDGRTKVAVAHTKLPSADDVGRWKAYWSDWLAALDDA
jgi:hypothetical protein